MFNLASSQGKSKFQPQEYTEYFEDCNFDLTPRWSQRGHCDTASGGKAVDCPWKGRVPRKHLRSMVGFRELGRRPVYAKGYARQA